MAYKTQSGKHLSENQAFSLGGVDYPPGWLSRASESDKASIGLSEVPDPRSSFKDSKFYINSITAEGESVSIPRDLDSIRAELISHAKTNANSLLSGSDWQEIAKFARGREIPEDWAAYRAAVISECERYESEVLAADFNSIQGVLQSWPLNPDEEARRLAMEAEIENNPQVPPHEQEPPEPVE